MSDDQTKVITIDLGPLKQAMQARLARRAELVRKMAVEGLSNDEMDELERINADIPVRKP